MLYNAAQIADLEKVDVEYITMPGWKTSTAHIKSFEQFPPNAQAYVRKIEQLIGVPSEASLWPNVMILT